MGVDLTLGDDTAVIGVPGNGPEPASGAAYVFHRVGGVWQAEATLLPDVPVAYGYFGRSVATHANRVAVAAPTSSVGQGPGHAEVFERTASGWKRVSVLASGQSGWDGFGYSVGQSSTWLAVGYIGDGAGSVWLYGLTP